MYLQQLLNYCIYLKDIIGNYFAASFFLFGGSLDDYAPFLDSSPQSNFGRSLCVGILGGMRRVQERILMRLGIFG